MKWYSYIICFILVISGVFCTIGIANIWSESSEVHGTVPPVEVQYGYDKVTQFSFEEMAFESEDNLNYTFKSTEDVVSFDGSKKNYVLFFNDNLVSDVELFSGKIVASLNLKFYGTDGSIVSIVKLNILIEFFDGNTEVTIKTKNDNNSMAYLTQYVNVNGATIKVLEGGNQNV